MAGTSPVGTSVLRRNALAAGRTALPASSSNFKMSYAHMVIALENIIGCMLIAIPYLCRTGLVAITARGAAADANAQPR
eukprot:2758876-Pleurochrysis_carterae.AAC.1